MINTDIYNAAGVRCQGLYSLCFRCVVGVPQWDSEWLPIRESPCVFVFISPNIISTLRITMPCIACDTETRMYDPAELVSAEGAARLLSIPADEVRRWEKKGLVRAARKANGQRFFLIGDLKRLQQSQSGESLHEFQVLISPKKTRYKVIELFSGAGGLALGLENAGLKTELLVEFDKDAAATLALNRPRWKVIPDDVSTVNFKPYKGKIDIVAGGFPCQAFSYAGHGRGFEDTRGTLFFEFARCVSEVQPRIALGENVRGLIEHDKGRTLKTMIRILDELGYDVEYRLLRAQFLDVPQKRERLVILGIRRGAKLAHLFPVEKSYTVTLREALRDCPPSGGARYPERKRQIMELVPAGGYWKDLPEDLRAEYMKGSLHLSGGKTGMARRLSWDEPSLTLTCNPAQKQTERCHPGETRPLTVREYARIQSFPDDWQFAGSLASQYKQIGNAVPVNLGFHIGAALVGMLTGGSDRKLRRETEAQPRVAVQGSLF